MARKKKKQTGFPSLLQRLTGKRKKRKEEYEELEEELQEELPEEEYEDELFDDEDLFEEDVPEQKEVLEENQDLQINLVDKGKALVAQAFVPGLDEADIDIDLAREMLTITTESNDGYVERDGDYLYEELFFGTFSRSILLPTEVEVEEAKAEVRDGILTVVMPKINKAARKKVNVKKK